MYDVIIVGMGPAGMGAAIYAQRSGLNILILEKNMPGGLLNKTNIVENYLGYTSITGPDLSANMFKHINDLEILYKIEEVENISDKIEYKEVKTNKNTYQAKAVIICVGRTAKTLLPNEKQYLGKGLSYCGICDAPLYKGKDIAIIGSGNSAVEEAIFLTNIVNKLYLLVRGPELKADDALLDDLSEQKNVEILLNTNISDVVLTDDKISSIKTTNPERNELNVEGLFIYIGYSASVHYLKDLDINEENGYIITDENARTNIKGIYAAGDAVKKDLYQIITAVSEGSKAATSAKKDIGN